MYPPLPGQPDHVPTAFHPRWSGILIAWAVFGVGPVLVLIGLSHPVLALVALAGGGLVTLSRRVGTTRPGRDGDRS